MNKDVVNRDEQIMYEAIKKYIMSEGQYGHCYLIIVCIPESLILTFYTSSVTPK